jgi:hypothetical protein
MVYCGPVNPGDPTAGRHEEVRRQLAQAVDSAALPVTITCEAHETGWIRRLAGQRPTPPASVDEVLRFRIVKPPADTSWLTTTTEPDPLLSTDRLALRLVAAMCCAGLVFAATAGATRGIPWWAWAVLVVGGVLLLCWAVAVFADAAPTGPGPSPEFGRLVAFADLADPEYEWAREQMGLVGVDLPPAALRLRPDPRLVQTYER